MQIKNKKSEIEYIQSTLCKIGQYNGIIDGQYNMHTIQAICNFQRKHDLHPTGKIDVNTKKALVPYMRGYIKHIVKKGDTINTITRQYPTTPQKLIKSNRNVNPFILQEGDALDIPFDYECTYTDVSYTYEVLHNNIIGLQKRYPFIHVFVIGKSVEGRNIYALHVGSGKRKVFVNAGCHACEWITIPVLMKWLEAICELYVNKGSAYGTNINQLLEQSTIAIVPMINPDGIELQINGVLPESFNYYTLVEWNNHQVDFKKWKANIRGVDLNRNFNAEWEAYKQLEIQQERQGPWFEAYAGPHAESEPEVRAIVEYVRKQKFDLMLCYHTQGEVIYWNFMNRKPKDAEEIAQKFEKASGYCLDIPNLNAAYAGCKDWFIQEFDKPGYTIECGLGENPIPLAQFNSIYEKNFELLLIAAWGK